MSLTKNLFHWIEMNDAKFLFWLMNRLVKVHGDSEHSDFVLKLRSIIEATPDGQFTPNAPKVDLITLAARFN